MLRGGFAGRPGGGGGSIALNVGEEAKGDGEIVVCFSVFLVDQVVISVFDWTSRCSRASREKLK